MKAKIVCFCGSTRFAEYFMIERWKLEKQGIITLGINILPDGYFKDDNHHGAEQEGVKHILDELHKRKIDLSDEVFVLNVGGYIGDSTRAEIEYATSIGKPVVYLEASTASVAVERPVEGGTEGTDREWDNTVGTYVRISCQKECGDTQPSPDGLICLNCGSSLCVRKA